ncbi:hypothetical protein JOE25_002455 [Serratia sp. PL17]|nr:hypothetical protein [Serratia sp. PL17]
MDFKLTSYLVQMHLQNLTLHSGALCKVIDLNPLILKTPLAHLGVLSITVGRFSENLIQICR